MSWMICLICLFQELKYISSFKVYPLPLRYTINLILFKHFYFTTHFLFFAFGRLACDSVDDGMQTNYSSDLKPSAFKQCMYVQRVVTQFKQMKNACLGPASVVFSTKTLKTMTTWRKQSKHESI